MSLLRFNRHFNGRRSWRSSRKITFYLSGASPESKFMHGSVKGGPIRLPSYIKCHRASFRFYSWCRHAFTDQLSPNLVPLRRSRAGSSSVREKSIRISDELTIFDAATSQPFHFPRSPSRSDFILSPREEMAGHPVSRVPQLFAIIQLGIDSRYTANL